MANRYVEVPRAALAAPLEAAGFRAGAFAGELVYTRTHDHDPRLSVQVATSIPVHGCAARPKDADAIRVTAVFKWRVPGDDRERCKVLHRAKILRVNAVEGVVARTVEAAREGYAACNRWRQDDWAKRHGKG